jgi:hypothetical protein
MGLLPETESDVARWRPLGAQNYLVTNSRRSVVAFPAADVQNIGLPEDFPALPVVDLEAVLWGNGQEPGTFDLHASKVLVTRTAQAPYGVILRGRVSTLSGRHVERVSLPPLLHGCAFLSGVLVGETQLEALVIDILRLGESALR